MGEDLLVNHNSGMIPGDGDKGDIIVENP